MRCIQRLIAVMFLPARDPHGAIDRDDRRQAHMTRATLSHYRRRGNPVPWALLTG